jgi:hypothetical protein
VRAPSPRTPLAWRQDGAIVAPDGAGGLVRLTLAEAADRHAAAMRGMLSCARRRFEPGVAYHRAWEAALRAAIASQRTAHG